MKLELCSFSGFKIHPGHGRTYARLDGKVFNFINSKNQSLFHQKKNARKIAWTVLYRRKHRKGITEEATKKRTRRTQKFQRTIEGVTEDKLRELRNQTAEVRLAQRQQALRAAKEQNKAKAKAKTATKPKAGAAAAAPKQKAVNKNVAKSAPRVGGKK